MTMLVKHAFIRLRVAASNPLGFALLLFSGLVTIVFWPGLTDASGAGWPAGQITDPRGAVVSVTVVLLWLVMWPMIASSPLRGQVVKGRRSGTFATQAHPTLPIGPRTRVIVEALTVLVVVMIIRAPILFSDLFGDVLQTLVRGTDHAAPWREWFIEQSLAGGLIMLPFLLLGGRVASSIEAYWLRGLVLAIALFGAMKLGWLETLPLCLVTCLTLSILVLLLPEGETRRLTVPQSLIRSSPLARPFRSPESQFRRDLWLRPLPIAAGLLAAEVVFIILDQTIELPELAFYLLSVLVFSWLLSFVPLQPMRSKMAMAGVFCKPGFQPGDFADACGVLPIRRRVMTRSAFVYGLVTTAFIWSTALGVIALSSWFDAGVFGLLDSDGDSLARLLLPSVAMIPSIASLLICSIHGNRRGALLSGVSILILPVLGLVLQINDAPAPLVAAVTLVVASVGFAPAVRHLRD